MANTAAHLLVSARILELCPTLVEDRRAFYLGSVAPDTIESKYGATRADKKRVHLRQEISDMEWLQPEQMAIFDRRAEEFTQKYIREQARGRQRDFNIGYLTHLLTDKCNHSTIRQKLLKAVAPYGVVEGSYDFFGMVINDLEALDCYILENHPDINSLFGELIDGRADSCLHGYIEKEYLERSFIWWRESYLTSIKERELKYIEPGDIEDFAEYAAEEVLSELKRLI